MKRMKSLVAVLAACMALAATPSFARATEVKIDNVSNDDVYVVIAYKFWRGDLGSEGWFKIESNKSRTFTAPDASDMYIRVEKMGKEVVWKNHNTYANWPVHPTERFTVSKSPLNNKVIVYKWGATLANDQNIKRGDPIPQGFASRRFFRVGNGKHGLDVLP